MKRKLSTIEGCDWVYDDVVHTVTVDGFMRVCTDGKGPHHGDKTAQNDTAYPGLNADEDCYVVVPMKIRKAVPEVVMGCAVTVQDLNSHVDHAAVCGDSGPDDRTGEASRRLVAKFALSVDPNHGGWDSSRRFRYIFHVGAPAPGYHLVPASR